MLLENMIAMINRDIINEPVPDDEVPPSVMDFVVEADATSDNSSPLASRNLRVSSLVGMCARQAILMHRMTDRPQRRVSSATRVAYAVGHGIHRHVAEQVIAARGGRGVWGNWRCRCGYAGRLGFKPVNLLPCTRCNGGIVHYNEAHLVDRDRRIEGHPDLILGANEKLYLVEVKSMAEAQFDRLTGPVHEHLVQALMYRELMISNGYGMADEVILFYVRKQWHYRDLPYKEFVVDATTGLHRLAVVNCFDVARQVWEALDSNATPPRTLCVSTSSPTARECPVAVRCFSS